MSESSAGNGMVADVKPVRLLGIHGHAGTRSSSYCTRLLSNYDKQTVGLGESVFRVNRVV